MTRSVLRPCYRYQVTVNVGNTRRQRVANWLRVLAWWLDGRITLAIEIQTTPALTTQQTMACVDQAHGAIERAVDSTLQAETIDRLMRTFMPQLYAAPDPKRNA